MPEYVMSAPSQWKFLRADGPYEVVERRNEQILLRLDDGATHWFEASKYVPYEPRDPED